jgi:hypothetical protein
VPLFRFSAPPNHLLTKFTFFSKRKKITYIVLFIKKTRCVKFSRVVFRKKNLNYIQIEELDHHQPPPGLEQVKYLTETT